MKIFRLLSVSGVLLCAACASTPEKDLYVDMSAQQIYTQASTALRKTDYEKASKDYEGLESHYPYGRYTEKGQLEIIYAYYKKGDAASALAAADHFIKLHPLSPHVDYAYYMRGLIKLNENKGVIDKVVTLDPSLRDPSAIKEAIANFSELLKRYPNSIYVGDARKQLLYARNLLAHFELNAANYYFIRGAYVASVNRAATIVQDLPQTEAIPEALQLLVKNYHALGLTQKAADAERVLARNYPNHV
jgi:outer membrane protein assembly factor BamD